MLMQNRNSNKSIERSLFSFFHEISKTQLFNNLFVLINPHTHTYLISLP